MNVFPILADYSESNYRELESLDDLIETGIEGEDLDLRAFSETATFPIKIVAVYNSTTFAIVTVMRVGTDEEGEDYRVVWSKCRFDYSYCGNKDVSTVVRNYLDDRSAELYSYLPSLERLSSSESFIIKVVDLIDRNTNSFICNTDAILDEDYLQPLFDEPPKFPYYPLYERTEENFIDEVWEEDAEDIIERALTHTTPSDEDFETFLDEDDYDDDFLFYIDEQRAEWPSVNIWDDSDTDISSDSEAASVYEADR